MNLEVVLILVVFVLLAVIFYLFSKLWNKSNSNDSFRLLQDQILALNKSLDFKLSESNRNTMRQWEINTSISKEASQKIEEITKKLSSLEETNKQIKDIWSQLEWLESILKNPKQRGILWEYFLENVLKNILPPDNFELQYSFANGEIVDWVIFVKEKK